MVLLKQFILGFSKFLLLTLAFPRLLPLQTIHSVLTITKINKEKKKRKRRHLLTDYSLLVLVIMFYETEKYEEKIFVINQSFIIYIRILLFSLQPIVNTHKPSVSYYWHLFFPFALTCSRFFLPHFRSSDLSMLLCTDNLSPLPFLRIKIAIISKYLSLSFSRDLITYIRRKKKQTI